MRKVAIGAIVIVFLLALSYADEVDPKLEFILSYYKGDYARAHELLNSVSSDPITQQIWENRIHLRENIPNCKALDISNHSIQSLAQVHMGDFENAEKNFTEDWVSHWAKAIYRRWTGDVVTARKEVQEALSTQPERPDLLFLAGDVSATSAETIDYFSRFLKTSSEDEVKKNIAEFSIEFLKKTEGIDLNIVSVEPGVQEIETSYDRDGTTISATLNSSEKVRLLVDTGAGSGFVLEHRNWKPQVSSDVVMLGMGKKQISKSTRVVLNSFNTAKFIVKNPVATESEKMPYPGIDGLLGSAVFSSHRVLLPVRTGRKLALIPYDVEPSDYFAKAKLKFSKMETFPFYIVNKLMILKGRIKKSPNQMNILVDTGSDVSFISIADAKKYANINYPLSMQLRRQSTVSGVGGKADSLLIAENVEVGLGNLERNFNSMYAMNFAETSEALELEIDLLLGRDYLDGYTLLIDYKNRQLTFLK
jgi:hypothetical protein